MKTTLNPAMMLPIFAVLSCAAHTLPVQEEEQDVMKVQSGYMHAGMMRADIRCGNFLLDRDAPQPEVHIVYFRQGYGEILARKRAGQGDDKKGDETPSLIVPSIPEERTPVAGCFVDGAFLRRVHIAREGDPASIV